MGETAERDGLFCIIVFMQLSEPESRIGEVIYGNIAELSYQPKMKNGDV